MSITKRYTAGRATVGSTVYPVEGFSLLPAVVASHVNHSGLLNSTQVLVAGNDVQRFSFRTPLSAILTGLGLVPTNQDTVVATFARTEGGLIESGNVHTSYTLSGSSTAWIDEFSVTEGEAATATVAIDGYSDDGSTEVWTKSDTSALPALSAAAVHHGIGPVTINGTAIPQVTGIRYTSGLSVTANRVDGLPLPTGGVISGLQQSVTIDVSNVQAAWAALGGKGLALNGTTGAVINLLRYTPNSGAMSATGQIVLTALNGFASIDNNDADHGAIGSGSITIRGTSAGALSAFVVS